jgi:hypothetical protein
MKQIRHGPGRPPKYGRPSRAVSITLPEDVMVRLSALDSDLGSAIVRLADRSGKRRERAARPAEVATHGNRAVIVVNAAKILKRLPGVQLVPIGNGRALISLKQPHSVAQFELNLRDEEAFGQMNSVERQTLHAVAEILQEARRSSSVTVAERTIIVLESKRQRRRS